MVKSFMGILYNVSRRRACRIHFSSCQAVDVIRPFLKIKDKSYVIDALLTLAYLIEENNSELIMSDEGEWKGL